MGAEGLRKGADVGPQPHLRRLQLLSEWYEVRRSEDLISAVVNPVVLT